ALWDAHLDGGQADAGRRIHGLEHVGDEDANLLADFFHRLGHQPQARGRQVDDLAQGHARDVGARNSRGNLTPAVGGGCRGRDRCSPFVPRPAESGYKVGMTETLFVIDDIAVTTGQALMAAAALALIALIVLAVLQARAVRERREEAAAAAM